MRKPTRLFIAISEMGGGVLLMAGYAFALVKRVPVPIWYLLLGESLAVIALIAGYRLLQNRSEGFKISLYLQGAQLVQLALPGFVYRVTLGAYLIVMLSADKTLIDPGFKGVLTVFFKGPPSVAFGINIVAAILFFLLARAIRKQKNEVQALADNRTSSPDGITEPSNGRLS